MAFIKRESSICVKSVFSILSTIFLLTLLGDIYAQSANLKTETSAKILRKNKGCDNRTDKIQFRKIHLAINLKI